MKGLAGLEVLNLPPHFRELIFQVVHFVVFVQNLLVEIFNRHQESSVTSKSILIFLLLSLLQLELKFQIFDAVIPGGQALLLLQFDILKLQS